MSATNIEWAKKVWNPVTGCTPVSRGCDHCYARRFARRLAGRFGYPYRRPFWPTVHADRISAPLRWRQGQIVFVDSMGDLFHPTLWGWRAPGRWDTWHYLLEIAHTMRLARQHRFIILTKRAEVMADLWPRVLSKLNVQGPLPNVWLGVSVEDQATAEDRIPLLLQVPAAIRVVSIEPMLGPVKLRHDWLGYTKATGNFRTHEGRRQVEMAFDSSTPRIDWVICGGETGPGARPMHPDWVRKVRDDCAAAGVPFFFKSWGEFAPRERATEIYGPDYDPEKIVLMASVGKRRAGRILDGRTHDEVPECLNV
ncbi:MAG: phage Gp37/Gp68 family protein [Phycisphaerae bacterium]|nr:phage Gp37/Gp68 family protein [Phycisphaerae bacterium]